MPDPSGNTNTSKVLIGEAVRWHELNGNPYTTLKVHAVGILVDSGADLQRS